MGTVARDLLEVPESGEQSRAEGKIGDNAHGQGRDFLSQILQRRAFAFLLGSAFALRFLFGGFRFPLIGFSVSHDSSFAGMA